jgi:pimeloyl-ACP methyl ester carboxylesterase
LHTWAHNFLAELRAGREVHLVGHSQGALITASALQQVKDYLNRPSWLGGPSGSEAAALKERFNQIKVESYGGAAGSWPQGPQYVHYVNPRDPVNLVGLPLTGGTKDLLATERPRFWEFGRKDLQQRAGGPGAVVNFVDDDRGPPLDGANHDFNAGYLYQRVDFDQARRGEFHDVQTRGRPVAGGPVEAYDTDGGELAAAMSQRSVA